MLKEFQNWCSWVGCWNWAMLEPHHIVCMVFFGIMSRNRFLSLFGELSIYCFKTILIKDLIYTISHQFHLIVASIRFKWIVECVQEIVSFSEVERYNNLISTNYWNDTGSERFFQSFMVISIDTLQMKTGRFTKAIRKLKKIRFLIVNWTSLELCIVKRDIVKTDGTVQRSYCTRYLNVHITLIYSISGEE